MKEKVFDMGRDFAKKGGPVFDSKAWISGTQRGEEMSEQKSQYHVDEPDFPVITTKWLHDEKELRAALERGHPLQVGVNFPSNGVVVGSGGPVGGGLAKGHGTTTKNEWGPEWNPQKRKKIYIAGRMRGIPYFNFPAFDAARDKLKAEGWNVISPADLDRETGFDETAFPDDYDWVDLDKIGFNLHDAVDRDVEALKKCDAIYMLVGWEKSKGACAEKALAEWIGLEVIYQDEVESFVKAVGTQEKNPVDVLEEALQVTKGDRQADYGPPDQDFRRTADMWSGLFSDMMKPGVRFEPFHIAQAMILLKMSRQLHQRKRDNWVDTAGYARCGSICDEAANA